MKAIPQEWHDLARALRALPGVVECTFASSDQGSQPDELSVFLRFLLEDTEGKIDLVDAKGLPHPAEYLSLPCLSFGSRGVVNVHFYAPPSGFEAAVFRDILFGLAARRAPDPFPPLGASDWHGAEILCFCSPSCSKCPQTLRAVAALAVDYSWIELHILEVERFTELAREYGIKSVPATLINREILQIGLVEREKVLSLVAAPGSLEYARERIRSLVNNGKAVQAGQLLVAARDPRILMPLFKNAPFSERIGLLVAIEEALSRDPRCLDASVDDLVSIVFEGDRHLRGDAAYLLGKISHENARKALRGLLADPDPDVAEIAREALDEVPSPHG